MFSTIRRPDEPLTAGILLQSPWATGTKHRSMLSVWPGWSERRTVSLFRLPVASDFISSQRPASFSIRFTVFGLISGTQLFAFANSSAIRLLPHRGCSTRRAIALPSMSGECDWSSSVLGLKTLPDPRSLFHRSASSSGKKWLCKRGPCDRPWTRCLFVPRSETGTCAVGP